MASNKTYQQVKHLISSNYMGVSDKIKHMKKPGNKQRGKQRR